MTPLAWLQLIFSQWRIGLTGLVLGILFWIRRLVLKTERQENQIKRMQDENETRERMDDALGSSRTDADVVERLRKLSE